MQEQATFAGIPSQGCFFDVEYPSKNTPREDKTAEDNQQKGDRKSYQKGIGKRYLAKINEILRLRLGSRR